jgi:hypothetical protein
MSNISRKAFIKTTAFAAATLFAGPSFAFFRKKPLLSFSTLVAPIGVFSRSWILPDSMATGALR